jgi:ParB-like chromosome segregation protein Spo0J
MELTETAAETPVESRHARDLRALAKFWFAGLDFTEQVALLNELRAVLREFSPFGEEPVDYVEWVPADQVQANSYNPNSVAPPEMELLRLSILADGYTQPIVSNREDDHREVVDGFHRSRVGKEFEDVNARIKGYLPLVQIRTDRGATPDRMAATIRHNRARGKHQVVKMSDIVLELKRRNWSDNKISKELGMDPDEVLRLAQITGLAEAFKDREFSTAWEAELGPADDDLDDEAMTAAGIDGGRAETETTNA